MEIKAKVQAIFQFTVRDSEGNIKRESAEFPNIVLDQGLELLGTSDVMAFCHVGSGVTPPTKDNTALEVFVAESSTSTSYTEGFHPTEGYCWGRRVFRFEQGVATGNISEVGVGGRDTLSQKVLFNRALVKDSQGFFATVTVMEDETLDVTVELRSYLNMKSQEYQVSMSGVPYSLRTEALLVDSPHNNYFSGAVSQDPPSGYSGGISSKTTYPEGYIASFSGSSASYSTREYVPGSKQKVLDMYWGLNAGNSAPLKTVVVPTNIGVYQTQFDPPINKTADHILKLTFTVSWSRYE